MRKNFSAQPDLTSVLDAIKFNIFRDINCIKLGQIEAYDVLTQSASVKLTVKVLFNDQDGKDQYRERPLLIEVPVIVLSGGDSYLSFPIVQGDECLVLFNDRDIENWYVNGGISTPNTVRMHDLSDAFAIVGIKSLQTAFDDIEADKVILRYNATNKIELEDGTITVTSPTIKHVGTTLDDTQAAEIKETATTKISEVAPTIEETATTVINKTAPIINLTGVVNINGALTASGGSGNVSSTGNNITQTATTQSTITAPVIALNGNVNVSTGATGSFTTNDGKTVTVTNGIIISIV